MHISMLIIPYLTGSMASGSSTSGRSADTCAKENRNGDRGRLDETLGPDTGMIFGQLLFLELR